MASLDTPKPLAPAGSPVAPPSAPDPAPLDDSAQRTKDFQKQSADLSSQMEKVATDTRDKNQKLSDQISLLRPPAMQPVQYEPPKNTPVQEQWGSWAMGFAMLASLFTRRPMVTALNAGSEVMSAFKQGDKEAADQAYERWQVATKNAMQTANYQQKAYQDALQGYSRQESINTQQGAAEERALQARINALATGFRDENMLKLGQDRGLQAQQREMDRRAKELEDGERKNEAMRLKYDQMRKNEAVTSSEEYQAAMARGDTVGAMKMLAAAGDTRVLPVIARLESHAAVADARTKTSLADTQQRATVAQDYIDKMIKLADGPLAGGALSQGLELGKEKLANALGKDNAEAVGLDVENPAEAFNGYSDALKMQVIALQTGLGRGMQNAEVRRAISEMLPNIGRKWDGSFGQATQLKILSNMLDEMQGKPPRFAEKEVLGATPKVGPLVDEPPAAAPATPGAAPADGRGAPATLASAPVDGRRPQSSELPPLRGGAPAAPAAPPPGLDTQRQPTPQERMAARPIRTVKDLVGMPAGWVINPQGRAAYWAGPQAQTAIPVLPSRP